MNEEMNTVLSVPDPMAYPDYRVSENPTPRQLRQMAVKAMEDMLTIRWTPDHYLAHVRRNPKFPVTFEYHPGEVFGGTPYCNAGAPFVSWFEYYDTATGVLSYPGDGEAMNEKLSSTCARSVINAWYTVVNSLADEARTYTMVQKFGYLPVGSYTYDPGLADYRDYETDKIIADNGEEVMLRSLSQVQAADGLVTTPGAHAIMAREDAHTVYRPDGSIDPDESYLIIQDQRGGKRTGWYEREYQGTKVNACGRSYHKYTFGYLLAHSYIPVTCAEFLGTKKYEAPVVTCTEENCDSVEALLGARLMSNYPMPVVKLVAEDTQGNETVLVRCLDKSLKREFSLSQLGESPTEELLAKHAGHTLKVVATVPNAQRFTPIRFALGEA